MAVPLDLYGALVQYTQAQTGYDTYLGREPEQTDVLTRKLPYIAIDGPFDTEWSFENVFADTGTITFHCFAVGDTAAVAAGVAVKTLYGDCTTWFSIPMPAGYKSIEASRSGYSVNVEDQTDQDGNIVYRYEVNFKVIATGSY